MIAGAEAPPNILSSQGPPPAAGSGVFVSSQKTAKNYKSGESDTGRLADLVDLSDEARAQLQNEGTLQQGRGETTGEIVKGDDPEFPKGLQQTIEEFAENFENDDRIPPGLMKVLRDLIAKVEGGESLGGRTNKIA